jgi:hypothetical protein
LLCRQVGLSNNASLLFFNATQLGIKRSRHVVQPVLFRFLKYSLKTLEFRFEPADWMPAESDATRDAPKATLRGMLTKQSCSYRKWGS